MKLNDSFYNRENVIEISRDLLGKVLFSKQDKTITAGIITETEAYAGITDRASHAFGGRRTQRTEVMYAQGGTAYVYLCYGIHHLFNVVTNKKNVPHAVLIRALQPLEGIPAMQKRRGIKIPLEKLCSGPGSLSQAMGITVKDTHADLSGNRIWIENQGIIIKSTEIKTTPRIGVDYAGKDAKLPYRFLVNRIK